MKLNPPLLLSTALAVIFVLSGNASAAVWTGDGVDDEYSTVGNWFEAGNPDADPPTLDNSNAVPAVGTTQDINGAFTVGRSVNSIAGRTFLGGGATLNITAGVHSDSRSGSNIRNFVGRGSDATINQSGGDYDIGHMLSVGGGGANGNGAYFLTGGALKLSRGANSIIDAANPHGRPSLEVSDEEDAGAGLFQISGGSLLTRFGAGVGPTGVFSVVGSASTINIGNKSNGGGDWLQQSGGTLKASVDAGGISTIFVNDLNAAGEVLAEFKSGSLLDLSFNGITPVDGTWTILSAEGTDISDGGLALSESTGSDWTFAIDNSGPNGLLKAIYGSGGQTLSCDFNSDSECDTDDLEMMYDNWGVVGGIYDVDQNEVVNAADIGAWLAEASSTSNPFNTNGKTFALGDSDFDGDIDSSDLGVLLNNFGDANGLKYTAGNLNDDNTIDSGDLGLLLNDFGFSSAAASAVPEPTSGVLMLMFLLTAACSKSLRRRNR